MASCSGCFCAITASLESLVTRASSPAKTPAQAAVAPVSMPPPIGLLRSHKDSTAAACVAVNSQPLLAGETEEESKAIAKRQREERQGPEQTKALGEALQQKDVVGALYAIKHGANTAMRYGPRRNTALHLAAVMENPVLMHRLVMGFSRDRAFLNKQNKEGETALMRCVRAGDLELCQVLIMAKCDVNIEDFNGQTALDYAKASEHTEIAEALQEAGAQHGSASILLA